MGEEAPPAVDIYPSSSSPPLPSQNKEKAWHSYISEDLPRTVQESTDSALRSARFIQYTSSTHLRTLQVFGNPTVAGTIFLASVAVTVLLSLFIFLSRGFIENNFSAPPGLSKICWRLPYEEVFFGKIKAELVTAREHPAMAGGIGIATGLLLMRGPRRFLFRQTLGRLQSEEAKFSKAEKNVKELSLSVDLMKKESKKLLERAALAEKDMKRGLSDLMDAGKQIQSIGKTVYKVEAQAADLMDVLREIPGREALKLRAEVASMASHLRQQRTAIDKRIFKVSELGVPI
ncbi:PREDICTED: uncharacterized protein LOC109229868 [Nicotiana attenuata]|uniref:uncharacterized protein LOC109229868 n=1 Tax=Nicotiana attenuata TaxID=49451 RepID=UPI000904C051|nr:PREDICTED: uncharacterized protein LOC109229868 [Nicotiana attenuata]